MRSSLCRLEVLRYCNFCLYIDLVLFFEPPTLDSGQQLSRIWGWVMRMKSAALICAAMTAFISTSASAASIVYNVDISGPGSLVGQITTDGGTGNLGSGDIVDFNLVANAFGLPSDTFTGPLSGNNAHFSVYGTDLTATSTGLFYNFASTSPSSGFFTSNAAGILCFNNSVGGCSGVTSSYSSVSLLPPGGQSASLIANEIGNVQIGAVSAVPLPSTWGMMLMGLIGLGFMGYRQKSKPLLIAA
jgi:hypothetical protein